MNSKYRLLRNWENLQRATFDGVGLYEVPEIFPANTDCDLWIGCNVAKTCDKEDRENHGIHFFDDYPLSRLWADPDRYVPMLKQFKAVMSPDFPVYSDFPSAIQTYNHYRKHWLGAYWQLNGMTVIPTINWGDADSFSWCFDGEPVNSTVAVSFDGSVDDPSAVKQFVHGFAEMLIRLQPKKLILCGAVPSECNLSGLEIIRIESYRQKLSNRG